MPLAGQIQEQGCALEHRRGQRARSVLFAACKARHLKWPAMQGGRERSLVDGRYRPIAGRQVTHGWTVEWTGSQTSERARTCMTAR